MAETPLYELDKDARHFIIKSLLEHHCRAVSVSDPIEGTFGEIYIVELGENTIPKRIVAKCPMFKKFGNREMAKSGIEQLFYELEKTHNLFMIPWINRFFDINIICGWPFIVSNFRDGTLEDLIANGLAWSTQDRFASLIQIVRALRLANERGIKAHQDLKPANIFFEDLTRSFKIPNAYKGMHFRMYVADFGIADAFREFGRNAGSRPYMAPEQYSDIPIDPAYPVHIDIFALGVLVFECFCGGLHPIGEVTSDVWPAGPSTPRKWNRARPWREWAHIEKKELPPTPEFLPCGIGDLVLKAICVDPRERPSLEEFETRLWEALVKYDRETQFVVKHQIDTMEEMMASDTEWPHMDDRIDVVRRFYAGL